MRSLSKKFVALMVALIVMGLPFIYYSGRVFTFWKLAVLVILGVVCWAFVGLMRCAAKARFGERMTLEEILHGQEPIELVQRLRYHLGWTPEKIAAELNRRQIHNQGRPWQVEEIRQVVRGITRVW